MSRLRFGGAIAAALVFSAPGALAAPFEFAGLHAGGHVGFADLKADFDAGGSLDESGGFGGLQVGYNIVSGNLLYGVETDFSLTGADPDGDCPFDATLGCDVDVEAMATLRGRLGYSVDDWLVYATGGIAGARFEAETVGALGSSSDQEGKLGWTLGAGVEYLVDEVVGVKLEYRYLNFSEVDIDSSAAGTGPFGIDPDMHVIMGGINFHF